MRVENESGGGTSAATSASEVKDSESACSTLSEISSDPDRDGGGDIFERYLYPAILA